MRAISNRLRILFVGLLMLLLGAASLYGVRSLKPEVPVSRTHGSTQVSTQLPKELQQFLDTKILQDIDLTADPPRLIVGDQFNRISPGLRIHAKLVAQSSVRTLRPDATTVLIVDQSGKTIEKLKP